MSRRWLIVVSGVGHLAIAGGLWISGTWRIDRLDGKPPSAALALMQPAPAPSGAAKTTASPKVPKLVPKVRRTVVKTIVLPTPVKSVETVVDDGAKEGAGGPGPGGPDATGKCLENCVGTVVIDPVCGNGAVEAGEQCDDGNATNGDGCSSTCRTEPRLPVTAAIAPTVLKGLRTSGEEQVHPSSPTQNAMLRDGATKVRGVVKLCIATDGSVASAAMSVSTKYDDYDATLLGAVRGWRYQPYTVNGTPVPACSQVTFVYTIK
jgi:TonB family protein